MTQAMIRGWQQDRLHTAMIWCWYATVITSFMGSTVLSLSVPAVGELFPFRVFLPVTALLYVVWAVRTKEFLWGELSFLEKVTYILAVMMVVYGAVSLPRAIEFGHTFTRLFNLCLDVAFFLLFLRLCRYPDIRRTTIRICLGMLVVLLALGVYESIFGGIWIDKLDKYEPFPFFQFHFHFPLVFYSNPNDYVATIVFLISILLIDALRPSHRPSKYHQVGMILIGIASYFVIMAANGRLAMAGFFCLLVGGLLCLWIGKRKGRVLITVLLLVGLLGVEFGNRYYYLMPQIEAYIEAVTTQPAPVQPPSGSTSTPPDASTSTPPDASTSTPEPEPEPGPPPTIEITRPGSKPISEQFFEKDQETGELTVRESGSSGIRLRLLIHAGRSFLESYGLGVGLGNTEILARDREVAGDTWNIHCFVARIIGDYGIFVLIPLMLIGLSLLKSVFTLVWSGLQKKNRLVLGYGVLFLFVLMGYPFASTAPSDAQDVLSMWSYLGFVVLEAAWVSGYLRERTAMPQER